jgi:methylamine dehydrogenase accessory protein MauD
MSWVLVLILSFLVIGVLRSLGLTNWRIDQLEITRPSRMGRDGLKVGSKAPGFTLPSTAGHDVSLHDYAGRKLLLVFTQASCGPCHDMAREFNRLHAKGGQDVLVVNDGAPDETREWAAAIQAHFPVLVQENFILSKRYEIFATPFAFLIDEQGIIRSKGIVASAQYLRYVLAGEGNHQQTTHHDSNSVSTVERRFSRFPPSEEMTHG